MPPTTLPDDVRRLLDERPRRAPSATGPAADALRAGSRTSGWEVQDGRVAIPPLGRSSCAPRKPPSRSRVRHPWPRRSRSSPRTIPATSDDSCEVVAAHPPVDDVGAAGRGERTGRTRRRRTRIGSRCRSSRSCFRRAGAPRLGRLADARPAPPRRRGDDPARHVRPEPTGDFVDSRSRRVRRSGASGLPEAGASRADDSREFVECPPGEVDAIEAYCLAVRRAALAARSAGCRSLPLLPQRRPRPQLRRSGCGLDGGANRIRCPPATPRAPGLDRVARSRAGSAQQAQLLPLPRPVGGPTRSAAPWADRTE